MTKKQKYIKFERMVQTCQRRRLLQSYYLDRVSVARGQKSCQTQQSQIFGCKVIDDVECVVHVKQK